MALLVANSVVSLDAHAYRPFISTDAAGVDPRHIELELGYAALERNGGEDAVVAPDVALNVGLVPRLELVGEFHVRTAEGTSTEIADPGIFLKGIARNGVLQDHSGPGLAVETGVLIPAAANEDVGWEVIAIASVRLGTLLAHGARDHRFLLGCIWTAETLPFALDAGIRGGLNDGAPDWEVTFGVSTEISL